MVVIGQSVHSWTQIPTTTPQTSQGEEESDAIRWKEEDELQHTDQRVKSSHQSVIVMREDRNELNTMRRTRSDHNGRLILTSSQIFIRSHLLEERELTQ